MSSSRVLPVIHSVSAELAAIEAVQPRVKKRASSTRPSAKRADSRSMSPQAGLVTSTLTAGDGSSPGLQGFSKWLSRRWLCIRVSIIAKCMMRRR